MFCIDIFGSKRTLQADKRAKLANHVIDHLTKCNRIGTTLPLRCKPHNTVIFAAKPSDISGDGGCTLDCGARKDCGHVCR